MKKCVLFLGFLSLCTALALSGSAWAGTTGKIVGKVLDQNGEALPGANVVIEGQNLGSTADAEGFYVILRADPGLYTLKASLIGYQTESLTDVRVQADVTTEVDFRLEEATLELGEMVVKAERPPVEVDKTFSKYIVGADEIEQLPIVRTTSEMITLQPGVHLDGSDRMRGSNRPGEWRSRTGGDVAYYVDGVKIVNSDGAGSHNWKAINRSTVQEISVVTGGMNAEYGNAQAGVVSIITKDGSQNFHGWAEYRRTPPGQKHWGANIYESPMHLDKMKWGEGEWQNERDPDTGRLVHQRADYDEITGHEVEGNISGPLSKSASFIVSGKTARKAPVYPSGTERGYYDDIGRFVPSLNNYQGSYSVTVRASENVKMKIGGLFEYNKKFIGTDRDSWRNERSAGTSSGVIRGLHDSGKNIFLPEDWSAAGKMSTNHNMQYLAITHSLSPRTFYDLRISRYSTVDDTSDIAARTSDVRTDADGWFAVDREVRHYQVADRKRYQVKLDLASQITKGHFVKAGFEFIKYSMFLTRYTGESAQARRLEFAGAQGVIGDPVKPQHLAIYAQDKMEFEGMVINAGLRLDLFDPVSKFPASGAYAFSPMYNSPLRFQNAPHREPVVFKNLSPRVGVSHPITARSSMHYFAGLFLAYPDIYYLFNGDWRTSGPDQDWNGNGAIDPGERYNAMRPSYPIRSGQGTTEIRPEKTVSMEVGADWNFVQDYTGAIAVYYKSAKDQYHYHSDVRFYAPHRPGWVHPYARILHNNGFEEQRGLEFSLRKPLSHNFAINLAYNMTWAQAGWGNFDAWFNFLYPDSMYIASGRYWYEYRVENGVEVPVPLTVEQIREIGHTANNAIKSIARRDGNPGGRGYEQTRMTAREYGLIGLDDFELDHIHVWARGYQTGLNADGGNIRNQGSVQFLYLTPGDYGPDFKVFGSKFLANWRVNILWRMQNTGSFWYTPPNSGRERRLRPIRTWTDFAIEKRFPFGLGRGDVSLFLEVRNLFNQKDDSSFNTTDWTNWGLHTARPDNSHFLLYGDTADRSFYNHPRRTEMGLRVQF